ncbi:helix-turn-helix domain-containing protein [Streptomyces osmaniensis]|uniref:Helix-turn-helix domain-containing protein n=1 Tax=Streptomyces osmaniensis TaxID=593134 RepID=A0ABP6W815_9ACTN|nr:helix-turn-helix transcriptional regulator [Streptomyces sp. JCM17656]
MRTQQVGLTSGGRDADNGWEVADALGGSSLEGVAMAGFRDRAAAGLDMRVLPQPAVIVVIGLGETRLAVEGTDGHRPMTNLVASMTPGPARIRGERVECVEVRLTPRAAYAVLGVAPHELHGSVTGLEDLWGPQARRLGERLADAGSWAERLALTDAFLTERAAVAPAMSPEVAGVWDTIVARRGRVKITDLAASCGWSRKRLWSRFGAQIGLTPKRAAMLVRFDHAARALTSGGSIGDVALACGYADQSHLHRDVLALAGFTPSALAAMDTSAG